jgi:hypothetical protein
VVIADRDHGDGWLYRFAEQVSLWVVQAGYAALCGFLGVAFKPYGRLALADVQDPGAVVPGFLGSWVPGLSANPAAEKAHRLSLRPG